MDGVTCNDPQCTGPRPARHKTGQCRPCYARDWRAMRRRVGGGLRTACVQEWVDWEVVTRAWNGEPTGRRLTRAERAILIQHAGTMAPEALGRLLGMEPRPAAKLARDVLDGAVQVIPRDWQGTPA